MLGSGFTDDNVRVLSHDIADGHHDAIERFDRYVHADRIPEGAGSLIFTGDGFDRGDDSFFLHSRVREPQLIHPLDPGFLHPVDIVGMVNNTHHIGFIVLNPMEIRRHEQPSLQNSIWRLYIRMAGIQVRGYWFAIRSGFCIMTKTGTDAGGGE